MISAATFEELADYAARGRIGSVVDLRCDNLYPEAETEVVLEWESEMAGVLEIAGADRIAVPAAGRRRIGVGAEPITVRLTAGGESAELLIQPRIFVPSAELRVAERIVLGAVSRIAWHSDADACTLRVMGEEGTQEHASGPAGGIDIVPQRLGELRIELDAIGRHAHLSPLLGIEKLSKTIQVVAPPVTISLDASEKTALIGDEASFSWTVEGSRAVRIEAPERGEAYPAQSAGTLVVEAGSQPERFRLVATSLDGVEKSAEFRLVPRLLNIAHLPFDLDALNLPWE